MIQHHRFSNGGFVLHKIRHGRRTYSAWFTALGTLIASEATNRHPDCHYNNLAGGHTTVNDALTAIGSYYVGKEETP